MRRLICVLGMLAAAGCASQPEEFSFEGAVPASLELPPPAPLEIVEVPRLLPLPGQRIPMPNTKKPFRSTAPAERVAEANVHARVEPASDAFINAMQVWPYADRALYQLYTRPDRVTDIALEPGEKLISASGADPVRWIIGDTTSGAGDDARVHLMIKPSRIGLNTNLVIHSDRRSYHLELTSTTQTWMASVAWTYPNDRLHALRRENVRAQQAAPIAEGLHLEQLNFAYHVSGDRPSWRPLRAFDDGDKVYIQFPSDIGRDEMPPLFVVGPAGESQLVNYRVRAPFLIVDRLFAAAELRLGKPGEAVRIAREGARESSRRATRSRGPRP